MDKEFKLETATELEQTIKQLEDRLYEHNSSATGRHDGELFSKIIKGNDNTMVAGIAGWVWANACEITHLWVDEKVRKNGIGKKLLQAAEVYAKSKGCDTIISKSYSFQAPQFYEAHGYMTDYILKDFPSGHSYYFLSKQLK